MATDVSICSAALVMVGADEINSFDDETRESKLCGILYETTLQNVLTEHPWRFSLGRVELAELEDTPLFGYTKAFQLPPDRLRLISMETPTAYEVFEDKLYTNVDPVRITYQFQPVESKFPPYFVRLMEFEMACLLAGALAEDESKLKIFRDLADIQKRKARNLDSQQQPSRAIRDSNHVLTQVRL